MPVQDDVCLLGDPNKLLTAYRKLAWRLTHSGLKLVPAKSVALADDLSRRMLEAEGFDVSNKFLVCLGVCISRDVNVMRDWLLKKTEQTHTRLFKLLGGGLLSAHLEEMWASKDELLVSVSTTCSSFGCR